MGRGQMAKLQGVGRNQGDKPGSGPGGSCVCPNCGAKISHTTNVPCNQIGCPNCGTKMTREYEGIR